MKGKWGQCGSFINNAPSNYGELDFDFANKQLSMKIWTPGLATASNGLADEYVIPFSGCDPDVGGCVPMPVPTPSPTPPPALTPAPTLVDSCGWRRGSRTMTAAQMEVEAGVGSAQQCSAEKLEIIALKADVARLQVNMAKNDEKTREA
jgi:hypothetical protein